MHTEYTYIYCLCCREQVMEEETMVFMMDVWDRTFVLVAYDIYNFYVICIHNTHIYTVYVVVNR